MLLGWGSAGSVLRSQGSSGEDGAFALRAGDGLIDSYACSGPIPLPLLGVAGRRASPEVCFGFERLVVGLECLGSEVGSVPHIYTKGVTLSYSGVMGCRHLMGMFWCAPGLGLRGIGPALAGKLGGGWSFRASR